MHIENHAQRTTHKQPIIIENHAQRTTHKQPIINRKF